MNLNRLQLCKREDAIFYIIFTQTLTSINFLLNCHLYPIGFHVYSIVSDIETYCCNKYKFFKKLYCYHRLSISVLYCIWWISANLTYRYSSVDGILVQSQLLSPTFLDDGAASEGFFRPPPHNLVLWRPPVFPSSLRKILELVQFLPLIQSFRQRIKREKRRLLKNKTSVIFCKFFIYFYCW